MTELEDRLRDAYRGATDTVRPDSIRDRGERATVRSGPGRWWAAGALPRLAAPLTAAAAVLVVGVIAVVVVPRALHDARGQRHGSGVVASRTGNPATHFLVSLPAYGAGSYLSVRDAATGAGVATLAPPMGRFFGPAATGNGISYAVVLTRGGRCGSWLYQFTISRTGRPGRLTRLEPGYLPEAIQSLAVSRNGVTLAFSALRCAHPAGRVDLGLVDLATGRLKLWSAPSQSSVTSLSLTADGRQLEFSTGLSTRSSSGIFVLATNSASGSAIQRGRLVIGAARFGRRAEIMSAVMTPDGRTIYFGTDLTGPAFNGRWALRAVSVTTGQSRLITVRAGFAMRIAAAPSGRELIAYGHSGQPQPPSPEPSPSGSPVPVPSSPAPTAVPSSSPASPSPIGSPSPTAIPSTPQPSPVPSVSPSQTPVPSASPSAPTTVAAILAASVREASTLNDQPYEIISVQLPGGRIRNLNPVSWDVAGSYFAW